MQFDNAVQIVVPDRESQFKLIGCGCGSDQVAYFQDKVQGELMWAAVCLDCGARTKYHPIRHDAQEEWNRRKQQSCQPCKGCKDRYPGCSDHCQKPEHIAWLKEREIIRQSRRNYRSPIWAREEPFGRDRL